MLWRWHAPCATSFFSADIDNYQEEVESWNDNAADEPPTFREQLNDKQQKQLGQLLQFGYVLDDKPGKTNMTEHHIETGSTQPIRLPPYCLPYALHETVQSMLKEMEREGVIERSASEWVALTVLVKKENSTLCMCVDYHHLNAISTVDAYPCLRRTT